MRRSAHSRDAGVPLTGLLVVNPRSGSGGTSAGELVAEARTLGVEVHELSEDEDPGDVARASRAEVLGMAGGDGSLAAVAAVALERDVPCVCVPFGTRNHFARDLGLDRDDPLGAVRAFGGAERRIDVGRADRRLFLNNVSLRGYAWPGHPREHPPPRRASFARGRAGAPGLTQRPPPGPALDR